MGVLKYYVENEALFDTWKYKVNENKLLSYQTYKSAIILN